MSLLRKHNPQANSDVCLAALQGKLCVLQLFLELGALWGWKCATPRRPSPPDGEGGWPRGNQTCLLPSLLLSPPISPALVFLKGASGRDTSGLRVRTVPPSKPNALPFSRPEPCRPPLWQPYEGAGPRGEPVRPLSPSPPPFLPAAGDITASVIQVQEMGIGRAAKAVWRRQILGYPCQGIKVWLRLGTVERKAWHACSEAHADLERHSEVFQVYRATQRFWRSGRTSPHLPPCCC